MFWDRVSHWTQLPPLTSFAGHRVSRLFTTHSTSVLALYVDSSYLNPSPLAVQQIFYWLSNLPKSRNEGASLTFKKILLFLEILIQSHHFTPFSLFLKWTNGILLHRGVSRYLVSKEFLQCNSVRIHCQGLLAWAEEITWRPEWY